MSKRLWLSFVVVAFGISACNDDSLPTGAERDLLKDAANIPALGGSKYASALEVFLAETGVVKDTVISQPPVTSLPPGSGSPAQHETDEGTGNWSKWKPVGWEHIADTSNRSNYKPIGYEHIGTGENKSKYKPGGWVHCGAGSPSSDITKYVPPGYQHQASGANATKYIKPRPVTPPDTASPIGPGTPIGNN